MNSGPLIAPREVTKGMNQGLRAHLDQVDNIPPDATPADVREVVQAVRDLNMDGVEETARLLEEVYLENPD